MKRGGLEHFGSVGLAGHFLEICPLDMNNVFFHCFHAFYYPITIVSKLFSSTRV